MPIISKEEYFQRLLDKPKTPSTPQTNRWVINLPSLTFNSLEKNGNVVMEKTFGADCVPQKADDLFLASDDIPKYAMGSITSVEPLVDKPRKFRLGIRL